MFIRKLVSGITNTMSLSRRDARREAALAAIAEGHTREDAGEFEAALTSYRGAIRIAPGFATAFLNVGNVLMEMGRTDEAVENYRKAASLEPTLAAAHASIGNALLSQGCNRDAIEAYQEALRHDPRLTDARLGLAHAFGSLGDHEQALTQCRMAVNLQPGHPGAHYALGRALLLHKYNRKAVEALQRADELDPGRELTRNALRDAWVAYGADLEGDGDTIEALACYRESLQIDPQGVPARWRTVFAQIPSILEGAAGEKEIVRENFARALTELEEWIRTENPEEAYLGVGSFPFYLAYHERNDLLLLKRYGAFSHALMNSWLEDQSLLPLEQPSNRGPLRLGIVSAHFRNHSVWQALIKGWLLHLDPGRFEISLFDTGGQPDRETEWAKSCLVHYEHDGGSILHWVTKIRARNPEILLFPEIGMDKTSSQIACMRLAPLQVVSWGHPETSGLPSVDCYLSAEAFEPLNAEDYYSEKLVRLPNLGCCYQPLAPEVVKPDLAKWGLNEGDTLFLCPGTPFKYQPERDRLLVEIARRLGKCRFLFFIHPRGKTKKLRARIEAAFAAQGLLAEDFVTFVPWLSSGEFYGLMQKATAMLDTIGFSGFNTAMQAIDCALPIVAWEGRFMRGRLASGTLRRMGLTDTITDTESGYVTQAVRLARDQHYRAAIVRHIESHRACLYGDAAPVKALESFLYKAARGCPSVAEDKAGA